MKRGIAALKIGWVRFIGSTGSSFYGGVVKR